MTAPQQPLTCQRCGRAVRTSADQYDVFERMHFVCFHFEFEHDPFDPDEECSAGGCPSRTVNARPMRRPENRQLIRQLTQQLSDRLTDDQKVWAQEYLTAGEWALALEMLADWLSEDARPITIEERDSFRRLADEMTITQRVMRAIDHCPDKPERRPAGRVEV